MTWVGAFLVASGLFGCADSSGHEPRSPNILLISIDSLRADHLGCYGYERDTSPNIDRLAREGTTFEHGIADSSWTLPTHATLFTGLTSQVHGVTLDGARLDSKRVMLAEVLQEAGYRCHGLWSGPYLHPVFGFSAGFDENEYRSVLGELCYDDPDFFQDHDATEQEKLRKRSFRPTQTEVTSPQVVEQALDFLSGPHEQPFFLFLHFFDVHYDYIPPEEDWRRFDPDYRGDTTGRRQASPEINPWMPESELNHFIALYDGEILFTDRYIGQVLDALDRLDLADDTVVLFTADHGEEFFEHLGKGHRLTLYDEVLRVPMILRWPGRVPAGRHVDAQARHIDVMPTLLDLVGLEIPQEVQGISLRPAWESDDFPSPRAPSSLELRSKITLKCLRDEEWKLIVQQGEEDLEAEFTLYDLQQDPAESEPVIDGSSPRATELWRTAREAFAEWDRREQDLKQSLPTTENSPHEEIPEEIFEQLRELGYTDES